MPHFARALSIIIGGCLLTGCATPVNQSAWQTRVEEYVEKEGHGDPSVLRDVTLADGRPGFGMIGGFAPSGSVDANGLLMGQRRIGDLPAIIYLVGVVEDLKVTEIRLAAVSFEPGGRARWRVGGRDAEALKKYNDHKRSLWKERFGSAGEAPAAYLVFPGIEDKFELEGEGEQTSVLHPASGARWKL